MRYTCLGNLESLGFRSSSTSALPDQNMSDVTVTWCGIPLTSLVNRPLPRAKTWMTGEINNIEARLILFGSKNFSCRSGRSQSFTSGRGTVSARWAENAGDWSLDLQRGSRRGERMTHTVWCDAHLATPRQCGGSPARHVDEPHKYTSNFISYDARGRLFVIKLSGWLLVVSERASVVIYRKFRAAWLPWKQCSSGENCAWNFSIHLTERALKSRNLLDISASLCFLLLCLCYGHISGELHSCKGDFLFFKKNAVFVCRNIGDSMLWSVGINIRVTYNYWSQVMSKLWAL